jgi:hypothetical protein
MNTPPNPDEFRQSVEDSEAEYLATVAQFSARLEVLELLVVTLLEKAGDDPAVVREAMNLMAKDLVQEKLLLLENKTPHLAALASVFSEGSESVNQHFASRFPERQKGQSET